MQLRNLALSFSYPSFPQKREPRDFSRLLLGPRLRGDDEMACPQDFLTASKAEIQGRRVSTIAHCSSQGQALDPRFPHATSPWAEGALGDG
jgi:hypothetical protein